MRKEEALLVKVIDLFAERFDRHAVLRGGMMLRILGCERLTNDVDYTFVPYMSKKDIVRNVVATLEEIDGAVVDYSLNSKCLRVILTVNEVSVQIEATTAMEVPTIILTTRDLASEYGLSPRLIPVVDYSVGLANKMAAWNERRLIRDIYDIWFYLKMGIRPDETALSKRLDKPEYSRFLKKADYFQGSTVEEFLDFLNESVQSLTDGEIAESLSDYLPPDELAGLSLRFRAETAKLK
jgi:predicted nucleotidyltransferase component of viral defense system